MKGQAFDTFKLLIAAVVAVAILGILFVILNSIVGPVTSPVDAIKTQLSKAYTQEGVSTKSPTQAAFAKDDFYDGSLPLFRDMVGGKEVNFKCGEDLGDSCDDSGNVLTANRKFDAYIRVCCVSTCNVLASNTEKVVCPD